MTDESYQQAIDAFQLGKFKKSLNLLNKQKKPTYNSLKLKLQLFYQLKQYLNAALVGEKLLNTESTTAEKIEVSFFTGVCYSNINEKIKAIEFLEHCVSLDNTANNSHAIFNLLCLYYQEGYYAKAVRLARKLTSLTNYFIKTHLILLKIAGITGDKKSLQVQCEKLYLSMGELDDLSLYELGSFLIDLKEYNKATNLITLMDKKSVIGALRLNVELNIRQCNFLDADELLTNAILQQFNTSSLFYLKANICHKLTKFELAFKYYSKAGQLRKKEWLKETVKDDVKNWNKFTDTKLKKATEEVHIIDEPQRRLAFIFGFPRSGTTLLDNILDTQENVVVISEMGLIPKVIARISKKIKSFPKEINKIKQVDIAELRNYYFELVRELYPDYNDSHLLIDKGPHHTELLPFLKLIFPEAQFIASIRHPIDVCLSCFQQDFEFNSPNSKLTTIELVIERYIQIFTLLERYEKELGIAVTTIKYEDIVLKFETTVKGLFNFLAIDANESYKTFNKHAASKYITSASRGQTDQELYSDSVYKWQHYDKHLAPYKERLGYFIEKYGYTG